MLTANGAPVTSTFQWVATTFRGGFVEVLRDGKQIRIDNLNHGSLGVLLEDRAAD